MRSSRRRAAWLRWRQRGKGHSKRHLANVYHHDLYSPLLVEPEDVVVMCGTITFERRCYLQSYIHRPTIRHCSDDGYTPGYWGDPDPRWDRTLHRRPERNQPWPAHRGGYRNATCRGPGALWGGRSLFRGVARCCCGRRDAHGGVLFGILGSLRASKGRPALTGKEGMIGEVGTVRSPVGVSS